MKKSVKHIQFSLLTLVGIMVFGISGYMYLENWTLFDSLYMTVITLATVGFREVHDLSDEGKMFTIALILFGAGTIAYGVGSLLQFMLEGQLREILGRRKLEKEIKQLRDHYIICGFGRIGRQICKEFKAKPVFFVVVEKDVHQCNRLAEEGYLFVQGDATADETLIEAGIERAKGLITAVTADTDNVYITLTARGLNPDLFILARSSSDGSEKKLTRAGANKVISPYTIGAHRMAQAIMRPSVVNFIEIATAGQNLQLQMEEIQIGTASRLIGTNLITSGIRKEWGIIIVGIKKKGQQDMIFNPAPHTPIDANDLLITLGEREAILKLGEIAAGAGR